MAQLDWTRSEMLVVIEALHHAEWTEIKTSTPTVQRISELLRAADFHGGAERPQSFRSPGSVHLKAENLRSSHSGYEGAEMHGGQLDVRVVAEYEADPERVLAEARGIRAALGSLLDRARTAEGRVEGR